MYKQIKLPSFIMLHHFLNPIIAIDEILFGKRKARTLLIKDADNSCPGVSYSVHCPHCDSIHDERLWSKSNSYGHWFGLICPTCNSNIPCLLNFITIAILVITIPIWFPLKLLLKDKWNRFEIRRLERMKLLDLSTPTKVSGFRIGIQFGMYMFIIMGALDFVRGKPRILPISTELYLWIGMGLLYGFTMKLIHPFIEKKKSEQCNSSDAPTSRT